MHESCKWTSYVTSECVMLLMLHTDESCVMLHMYESCDMLYLNEFCVMLHMNESCYIRTSLVSGVSYST